MSLRPSTGRMRQLLCGWCVILVVPLVLVACDSSPPRLSDSLVNCLRKQGIERPSEAFAPDELELAFPGLRAGRGLGVPRGVTRQQFVHALQRCGAGELRVGSAPITGRLIRRKISSLVICLDNNGYSIPAPNFSSGTSVVDASGIDLKSARWRATVTGCKANPELDSERLRRCMGPGGLAGQAQANAEFQRRILDLPRCLRSEPSASESGHTNEGEIAVLRYLRARDVLEQDIHVDMPAILRAAEDASRILSRRCAGVMAEAPRNFAFGALNTDALWTPWEAMWRTQRSMAVRFVKATKDIAWHDAAFAELTRAVSREEVGKATLTPSGACAEMRAWRASGYKRRPERASSHLERIAEILTIGTQAVAGLGGGAGSKHEHCVAVRPGITRCSSEAEAVTAPETVVRRLAQHGGIRARSMARRIVALERGIAHAEHDAYVRAGKRMTDAIGLDPAILRLVGLAK